MKVVVGSQSQVNLDTVKSAFKILGIEAEVTGVKLGRMYPSNRSMKKRYKVQEIVLKMHGR